MLGVLGGSILGARLCQDPCVHPQGGLRRVIVVLGIEMIYSGATGML